MYGRAGRIDRRYEFPAMSRESTTEVVGLPSPPSAPAPLPAVSDPCIVTAMGVDETVISLCRDARAATRALAAATTDAKNACLREAAAGLRAQRARLLEV